MIHPVELGWITAWQIQKNAAARYHQAASLDKKTLHELGMNCSVLNLFNLYRLSTRLGNYPAQSSNPEFVLNGHTRRKRIAV